MLFFLSRYTAYCCPLFVVNKTCPLNVFKVDQFDGSDFTCYPDYNLFMSVFIYKFSGDFYNAGIVKICCWEIQLSIPQIEENWSFGFCLFAALEQKRIIEATRDVKQQILDLRGQLSLFPPSLSHLVLVFISDVK